MAVGNGGQEIAVGIHQQRRDRCNNVRQLLALRNTALHDLTSNGKNVHAVDGDRCGFFQCGNIAGVVSSELGKLLLCH